MTYEGKGASASIDQRIIDGSKDVYQRLQQAYQEKRPLSEFFTTDELGSLEKAVSGPGNAIIPTVVAGNRGMDLFSQLLSERMVMIDTGVDEMSSSIACGALLFLETEASGAPEKAIKVHVMSPGGSVYHGLAIYDTIRGIKSPVETIGLGLQMSMGSILIASGDPGTRRMTENSTNMVHEVSSGARGKLNEMEIDVAESKRLNERLKGIYVTHTGLNHDFWDIAMKYNDMFLSAEQSVQLGLVDRIIPKSRTQPMGAIFAERAAKSFKIPSTVAGIKKMLQSEDLEVVRKRSDLIVALSRHEEFWTPTRVAEEVWKRVVSDSPELAAKMEAEVGTGDKAKKISLSQTIVSAKTNSVEHPVVLAKPLRILADLAVRMYKNNQEVTFADLLAHAQKGYKHILALHADPAKAGGFANDNKEGAGSAKRKKSGNDLK